MTSDNYLREVEFELRDLPWRQRRDLLGDLRNHLAELPPNSDLVAQLGTPSNYTAELRVAAHLPHRRGVIAFIRAFRPRNLVIFAVLLVLLGLLIGAVSWIDSYQPIGLGSGSTGAGRWQFGQGKPFGVGVSFVNNGRFTVHVTGVTPRESGLPVQGSLYLWGPVRNTGGFRDPSRHFHPFDLGPGQVAYVVFKGRFYANCHREPRMGEVSWELSGFDVHYSFLWRSGVAPIDLNPQLSIHGPKGYDCEPVRSWQPVKP